MHSTPLVHIRGNPEFHGLLNVDKSAWPRRLLRHGWLLLLACLGEGSPWANSAQSIGFNWLESVVGVTQMPSAGSVFFVNFFLLVQLAPALLSIRMSGLTVAISVTTSLALVLVVPVFKLIVWRWLV